MNASGGGGAIEGILLFAVIIVALALIPDFSNGFHDAASVVAAIITTHGISSRKVLAMAAACEFIGLFLFGTAVAKTFGKNIVDVSALHGGAISVSAMTAASFYLIRFLHPGM
jgi:inorganic phosphate transporter, PiT family